jgi:riboflavin kinase/FMN adenylyltransferase
MLHYRSLDDVHLHGAWMTIGSFDGVHLGHQEIAKQLAAGAHSEGAPAVVMTFEPHPSIVLGKRSDPFYLTTPEQRAELLGLLGIDVVVTHPFTRELSEKSALEFMQMVGASLGLKHLWVGYDFALGKGREGTVPVLTEIGERMGYQVHVTEPVMIDGMVISSSLIRNALAEGDVKTAARYLGRLHSLEGEVITGDGRGSKIGIPTANLAVPPVLELPKPGVYACEVEMEAARYQAVTNVGYRPTFENEPVQPRVEAHILDYTGDLYGKHIRLAFVDRIRAEMKFPGVQELVAQIHRDIETGRRILSP